jgi:hypothetical protein
MNLDQALRRYREGQFSDADVTQCTGLSKRSYRELIRTGAVCTITEDRGRGLVRLCDATVFKRCAIIAALNEAGWSLAVAGQIALALPFRSLLYETCDPLRILLESWAHVDPQSGLPSRVECPRVDWFDPEKPAKADPKTDWVMEIYESRFVGVKYTTGGKSIIFGDLRDRGASFVGWYPCDAREEFLRSEIAKLSKERVPEGVAQADFVETWEDPTPWSKDFARHGYRYERHDSNHDPLRLAAEAMAHDQLYKSTINVSLAVRKALRRYLGIEPAASSHELD